MPDKLTDKEIVKALECCASGEVEECKNCPYVEGYPYCDGPMERDVLDLINRLQAENERLSDLLKRHQRHTKSIRLLTAETAKKIKAEAYKEFGERLKERKYLDETGWSHGEHPYIVEEDDIDDVLEELAGD